MLLIKPSFGGFCPDLFVASLCDVEAVFPGLPVESLAGFGDFGDLGDFGELPLPLLVGLPLPLDAALNGLVRGAPVLLPWLPW